MRTRSSVSLREIADQTNLSITTVSRVLRHRGEVSDETRARVLSAARKLRYRPNLLVQGIQTGRTGTMGVMVPPYDSYWTEVLWGIHDELTKADSVYINAWCDLQGEEDSYEEVMLRQLHRLIDRRVDGLILWPHLAPLYPNHIEELQARDLPIVTIDHELEFADSVETDERRGAIAAAEHLVKLGHRNIGHVAWDPEYKWATLRRRYFEQAITRVPGAICRTVTAGEDHEVVPLTRKLLLHEPRPTAVFACSDRVAKLVYEAAGQMQLRIPEDLSVIGFADLNFASWMVPPLTTIRQDGRKVGRAAAELLLRRSQGLIAPDEEMLRVQIECELIQRGSTGPPST